MKRIPKPGGPGPEHDPIVPTLREIVGFLCPIACALVGYWIGFHFGGFMLAFIFGMVGVGLGSALTRAWAKDFYV